MQSRTILSGASVTALILGLLFGATVPTRILPMPEPAWRKMPSPAPMSRVSYQFVDAGPMHLDPHYDRSLRKGGTSWAESAARDLERDYLDAVEQAYLRRFDGLAPASIEETASSNRADKPWLPQPDNFQEPDSEAEDAVAGIPAGGD